jgi:hypothetical protein
MIFTDAQLADLTIAMTGGYPVVAVAFYAARVGPDDLSNIPEEQKRISIPPQWLKGIRWTLLSHSTPIFEAAGDGDAAMPMGEDFKVSADRVFLWRFLTGLTISLGALVLRNWPVASHLCCAAALILFVATANTFVYFVTQTAMLRLATSQRTDPTGLIPRRRFPHRSAKQEIKYIPFISLAKTAAAITIITAASIFLAAVIVIGVFI